MKKWQGFQSLISDKNWSIFPLSFCLDTLGSLEAIRNYAKQEHPDKNRGETAIKNFMAYLRDKYIEQDLNTKEYSILSVEARRNEIRELLRIEKRKREAYVREKLESKVVDKEKRNLGRKEILKVQFRDSSGFIECVWFHGVKYFYCAWEIYLFWMRRRFLVHEFQYL